MMLGLVIVSCLKTVFCWLDFGLKGCRHVKMIIIVFRLL